MRVRPVACHCARHMNCRAPTALAGPPPARLTSMASFNGSTHCPFSRLHMGWSGGHGVGWSAWALHGLDCMLEVVACRALDAQSLARSSCTKEGAAAFANSEKAMWPVAEVSCSRLLACGPGREELNLQSQACAEVKGPLARADQGADRGMQRLKCCLIFCKESCSCNE